MGGPLNPWLAREWENHRRQNGTELSDTLLTARKRLQYAQSLGETTENGEKLVWIVMADTELTIDACVPSEFVKLFNEESATTFTSSGSTKDIFQLQEWKFVLACPPDPSKLASKPTSTTAPALLSRRVCLRIDKLSSYGVGDGTVTQSRTQPLVAFRHDARVRRTLDFVEVLGGKSTKAKTKTVYEADLPKAGPKLAKPTAPATNPSRQQLSFHRTSLPSAPTHPNPAPSASTTSFPPFDWSSSVWLPIDIDYSKPSRTDSELEQLWRTNKLKRVEEWKKKGKRLDPTLEQRIKEEIYFPQLLESERKVVKEGEGKAKERELGAGSSSTTKPRQLPTPTSLPAPAATVASTSKILQQTHPTGTAEPAIPGNTRSSTSPSQRLSQARPEVQVAAQVKDSSTKAQQRAALAAATFKRSTDEVQEQGQSSKIVEVEPETPKEPVKEQVTREATPAPFVTDEEELDAQPTEGEAISQFGGAQGIHSPSSSLLVEQVSKEQHEDKEPETDPDEGCLNSDVEDSERAPAKSDREEEGDSTSREDRSSSQTGPSSEFDAEEVEKSLLSIDQLSQRQTRPVVSPPLDDVVKAPIESVARRFVPPSKSGFTSARDLLDQAQTQHLPSPPDPAPVLLAHPTTKPRLSSKTSHPGPTPPTPRLLDSPSSTLPLPTAAQQTHPFPLSSIVSILNESFDGDLTMESIILSAQEVGFPRGGQGEVVEGKRKEEEVGGTPASSFAEKKEQTKASILPEGEQGRYVKAKLKSSSEAKEAKGLDVEKVSRKLQELESPAEQNEAEAGSIKTQRKKIKVDRPVFVVGKLSEKSPNLSSQPTKKQTSVEKPIVPRHETKTSSTHKVAVEQPSKKRSRSTAEPSQRPLAASLAQSPKSKKPRIEPPTFKSTSAPTPLPAKVTVAPVTPKEQESGSLVSIFASKRQPSPEGETAIEKMRRLRERRKRHEALHRSMLRD
ncbi:hypothetical protein JCM16303_002985 [Sporobolomyces ruberrimus]